MARVALVTGGTRGIGAAIAEALKTAGYRVAANYAANEAAAREFSARTGIAAYKWNVADFAACREGVARVVAELGAIEVLVNNAGITRDTTLHKMSPEAWREVIETNLTSCFNLSRLVIEGMRERRFGRIVNVGSINGQRGQLGQTNYTATKAGVHGFTKSLAREGASRNITVNTIAPGYIDTEMVRAVAPEIVDKIVAEIPVGRLGRPEDVARAVVFLAADEASFITGALIPINGGHHIE